LSPLSPRVHQDSVDHDDHPKRHSHGSRPGGYQARGGAFGCESMTSSHALPIRTPEANTSAPPRTTCTADITKLMLK
jgi:hypothetical protein